MSATAQKVSDLCDSFKEYKKEQKEDFKSHEKDGKLRFEKLEKQINDKIGSCPYNGDIKLIKDRIKLMNKISYTIIMLILCLITKSWVASLIVKLIG